MKQLQKQKEIHLLVSFSSLQ